MKAISDKEAIRLLVAHSYVRESHADGCFAKTGGRCRASRGCTHVCVLTSGDLTCGREFVSNDGALGHHMAHHAFADHGLETSILSRILDG